MRLGARNTLIMGALCLLLGTVCAVHGINVEIRNSTVHTFKNIDAGKITVSPLSRLGGPGNINGNLQVEGWLYPDYEGTFDMYVDGNVTFKTGSVFYTRMDGGPQVSVLVATGAVSGESSVILDNSLVPNSVRIINAVSMNDYTGFVMSAGQADTHQLETDLPNGDLLITDIATDSDSDQMPDTWEQDYSLDEGDPGDAGLDGDSDTQLNVEEYIAGTLPNSPTSYFQVVNYTHEGEVIVFDSVVGRTYSLEYTTNLLTGTWVDAGEPPQAGTGKKVEWSFVPAGGEAKYRLKVELD